MGYKLYTGNLECQVISYIDHEYGDDSDDDDGKSRYGSECPSMMGQEDLCDMTITGIVDLNGTPIPGIPHGLELDEEDLLQGDFFRGIKPDSRDFCRDDYLNGEDRLTHRYEREVFVIFHKRYAWELMLESGGFLYAISELRNVAPSLLAPEDLSFAEAVLSKLGDGYELPARISQMLDIAVTWADAGLWNKICEKAKCPTDLKENDLLAALQTFGFEAIRPVIEGRINNTVALSQRLMLIDAASVHGTTHSGPNWRTDQHLKALASVRRIGEKDIPQVISLARLYGITKTMNLLLPVLEQTTHYERHYQVLTRKLHEGAASCSGDR
ncbi:hypothetical protein BDN72DRAFT_189375, partial [Pluteus cervinus]